MPYKTLARKRKITAIVPYGTTTLAVAKRRRVVFRRRRYGRRSALAVTSRNLGPSNAFKIRAKRLRKKQLRRQLWNYTNPLQHYRSISNGSGTLSTPNDTITQSITRFEAMTSVVDNEFWKSAGGLIATQFNFNLPAWSVAGASPPPTIVLRGGRLWCTVSSLATTIDVLRVRVQLCFVRSQLRNAGDSAASTTFNTWETAALTTATASTNRSLFDMPDAELYLYKPILDKSYDIHQGESVTHFWKIKPVKIDTGAFAVGGGWFPLWYIYVFQLNNSNAAAETVTVTVGSNLSFAAMEGNA